MTDEKRKEEQLWDFALRTLDGLVEAVRGESGMAVLYSVHPAFRGEQRCMSFPVSVQASKNFEAHAAAIREHYYLFPCLAKTPSTEQHDLLLNNDRVALLVRNRLTRQRNYPVDENYTLRLYGRRDNGERQRVLRLTGYLSDAIRACEIVPQHRFEAMETWAPIAELVASMLGDWNRRPPYYPVLHAKIVVGDHSVNSSNPLAYNCLMLANTRHNWPHLQKMVEHSPLSAGAAHLVADFTGCEPFVEAFGMGFDDVVQPIAYGYKTTRKDSDNCWAIWERQNVPKWRSKDALMVANSGRLKYYVNDHEALNDLFGTLLDGKASLNTAGTGGLTTYWLVDHGRRRATPIGLVADRVLDEVACAKIPLTRSDNNRRIAWAPLEINGRPVEQAGVMALAGAALKRAREIEGTPDEREDAAIQRFGEAALEVFKELGWHDLQRPAWQQVNTLAFKEMIKRVQALTTELLHSTHGFDTPNNILNPTGWLYPFPVEAVLCKAATKGTSGPGAHPALFATLLGISIDAATAEHYFSDLSIRAALILLRTWRWERREVVQNSIRDRRTAALELRLLSVPNDRPRTALVLSLPFCIDKPEKFFASMVCPNKNPKKAMGAGALGDMIRQMSYSELRIADWQHSDEDRTLRVVLEITFRAERVDDLGYTPLLGRRNAVITNSSAYVRSGPELGRPLIAVVDKEFGERRRPWTTILEHLEADVMLFDVDKFRHFLDSPSLGRMPRIIIGHLDISHVDSLPLPIGCIGLVVRNDGQHFPPKGDPELEGLWYGWHDSLDPPRSLASFVRELLNQPDLDSDKVKDMQSVFDHAKIIANYIGRQGRHAAALQNAAIERDLPRLRESLTRLAKDTPLRIKWEPTLAGEVTPEVLKSFTRAVIGVDDEADESAGTGEAT